MTVSSVNGVSNAVPQVNSTAPSSNAVNLSAPQPASAQETFQQLLDQTLQMVIAQESTAMETMALGNSVNSSPSGSANFMSGLGGFSSIASANSNSLSAMAPMLSLLPYFMNAQNAMTPSGPQSSPAETSTITAPVTNGTVDTAAFQSAQPLVQAASERYGIPASLLNAVIQQESGFDTNATSAAGAIGLMQLMPETAQSLGVTNPLDPAQNINGGADYLSQLLTQFNGNQALALAAYNAGPNAVKSYGGIPPYPETQSYVRNILAMTGQTSPTSA